MTVVTAVLGTPAERRQLDDLDGPVDLHDKQSADAHYGIFRFI
jgi:hypothetical protein